MRKGTKMSEESRQKMRESSRHLPTWLGRKHTEESKEKMRKSLKGRIPWNKGTKVPRIKKGYNPWNKGKTLPESLRKKISNTLTGKKHSPETKYKMRIAKLGKKKSLQTRLNMSRGQGGKRGSNWKGGITPINKKIRHSIRFRLWREAVFKRDNWTCVWCKKRGGILHPDHIKQFAHYPELRFKISNGRTLCIDCHKKTETWGNQKKI